MGSCFSHKKSQNIPNQTIEPSSSSHAKTTSNTSHSPKNAPKSSPKERDEGDKPEHYHDNDAIAKKAQEMRDKANRYRDEAHLPENKGENYKKLMAQAEEQDAAASKYIFESLNAKLPKGTIDLHLQYVKDAVRLCDEWYDKYKGSVSEYIVIVGKGNHSKGGKALIAPKIEEWASGKGLNYRLEEGKVICQL